MAEVTRTLDCRSVILTCSGTTIYMMAPTGSGMGVVSRKLKADSWLMEASVAAVMVSEAESTT